MPKASNDSNNFTYHSMRFFPSFPLAESPPRDLQILPSNNGLLIRTTVETCFSANNILLMRNRNNVFEKKNGRSLTLAVRK